MPNLASAMKDEITRLARKESKAGVGPVRADVVRLKKAVAGLRKQVADLDRALKMLGKSVPRPPAGPKEAPVVSGRQYMTGKGIRALRAKLNVSQQELGKLLDVSAISVHKWEQKDGKLTFRGDTLGRILELKTIGCKEAKKRLESAGK